MVQILRELLAIPTPLLPGDPEPKRITVLVTPHTDPAITDPASEAAVAAQMP